ncbi:ABC transporter permease [Ktedonosporobacter rubrisoli]|uniref:ABC transporter permease n=1 Tax=Ktedonosporobacter rubrisoli TaxID=2509675 RepID=A0A4P6JWG8_KTERU|nr:ABC transporter permease [Ktedonosporobacter rubrisoli]QBD80039.1 ABC transporter permease [Ktedonosporobacter rubrisoli]
MAQITTDKAGRNAVLRTLLTRGKGLVRQQGALLALVLLVIFASWRYNDFLTPYNIFTLLSYNTMLALIALGETFVIMTGGIDISVGSLTALCAVVAARVSVYGLYASLAAVVLTGALVGLFNGLAITRLRIPPFIATLTMLIGARGLALLVSKDATIAADANNDFSMIYTGTLLGIPIPIYIMLAAYAIGSIVLNFTRFGRHILAIGGNEEAARLLGLPVERITLLVYVISGVLAGLAGLLLAAQTISGNPNEAVGWELSAIAAVVVGGTLLTGGMGTVGGSLVGALLLGLIFNVLNFENGYGFISLSSYWETVIRGAFLLVVVILQSRLIRRKSTA